MRHSKRGCCKPYAQLTEHWRTICTMPSGGHLSGQFVVLTTPKAEGSQTQYYIISHVSDLSSCTSKVDGVPVGRHPLVAQWILGDRSLHPPQRSLFPPRDLSVIVVALIEKP